MSDIFDVYIFLGTYYILHDHLLSDLDYRIYTRHKLVFSYKFYNLLLSSSRTLTKTNKYFNKNRKNN